MSAVSNPYIFNIKNDYNSKAEINIAFTSQSWTSPGTYTWVAPFTGTITVCVIGGGGAGDRDSQTFAPNGNQSSFGNIIATGGEGGIKVSNDDSSRNRGGNGGIPNGRNGSTGNRTVSGGQGFSLSTTLTNGSYGSGGSAVGNIYYSGSSGGSGGCNIQSINIVKDTSYTIVVGSGGSGESTDNVYAFRGNSGAVGIWKE